MEGTRSRLGDPSSAQFSTADSWFEAKPLGKGVYRVQFQGRSRNKFNALVLGTFECRVRMDPNGATALSTKQIE